MSHSLELSDDSSDDQRHTDWVDDLAVVMGDSGDIQPPQGYTLIPFDLNKGAKGKYIYLCKHKAKYTSTGTNSNCINDIKIISGNNDHQLKPPPGYDMLPQDLNYGAKGKYVHLCFRKVPYDGDKAIKDVTVIGSKHQDIAPPDHFQRVPGDLNEGAGGDYVYVCTTIGS